MFFISYIFLYIHGAPSILPSTTTVVDLDEEEGAARSPPSSSAQHTAGRQTQGTCVICLAPLFTSEQIWTMPCAHAFHEECISRHVMSQPGRVTWLTGCPLKCVSAEHVVLDAQPGAAVRQQPTTAAHGAVRSFFDSRADGFHVNTCPLLDCCI